MRAAVACENGKVALDFAGARTFQIYEFEKGEITGSFTAEYKGFGHGSVLDVLTENRGQALICGNISGCMRLPLASANIHLFAGVSGDADEAAQACAERKLKHDPQAIKADSDGCAGCSGCG